jgi:hypothetical protein
MKMKIGCYEGNNGTKTQFNYETGFKIEFVKIRFSIHFQTSLEKTSPVVFRRSNNTLFDKIIKFESNFGTNESRQF